MNTAWMVDRLERFPAVLDELLDGVDETDAHYRASEDDWSIVEIICHLADEDRDDFGRRLRLLIESPEADWPKIDPVSAAVEREYHSRSLLTSLADFKSARKQGVIWLNGLGKIDCTIAALHPRLVHPRYGAMDVGDMLASWCAHDALHLRQLAHRFHQLAIRKAGDHDTGYAGEW